MVNIFLRLRRAKQPGSGQRQAAASEDGVKTYYCLHLEAMS